MMRAAQEGAGGGFAKSPLISHAFCLPLLRLQPTSRGPSLPCQGPVSWVPLYFLAGDESGTLLLA